MIEVQIKDKKLFNKFKSVASYSSELTGVCSFNDNMKDRLEAEGIFIEEKEEKKEAPIISMNGQIMYIKNDTPEILHFLGNKMDNDKEISIYNMDRVHMLILAGIITPDKKFTDFYSKIEETDSMSRLLYGGDKKLKGQSLMKELKEKYEKDDITFAEAPFHEDDYRDKNLSYTMLKVTFTGNIEKNVSGRGYSVSCVSQDGRKIVITLYMRPSQLEKLIMYNGGEANIAFTNYTTRGTMTFISAPEILPDGFNLRLVRFFTPVKRTVKTDYWRSLFHEYKYRISLNNKNQINTRVPGLKKLASEGIFEFK